MTRKRKEIEVIDPIPFDPPVPMSIQVSRPVGRPTLLTPALQNEIVGILSTGVTVKDTCEYVGIGVSTFYDWCVQYSEFSDATTRARAQARVGAALVVRNAAVNGDVETARWMLERLDPLTWGRKDAIVHIGITPQLLRELKAKADAKGVDLQAVFENMVAMLDEVETES